MLTALERYLAELPATEGQVWLTLNEIESLVGWPLPPSARRAGYWSKGHAHAQATWMRHGFVARLDRAAAAVRFTRRAAAHANRVHRSKAVTNDEASAVEPATTAIDDTGPAGHGKYAPLVRLLRDVPREQEVVQLTTDEIEAILGEPLPASALHPGYWSSPGLNASRAWRRLGFVVRLDRRCRRVLFIRKAA
ncbi:MAG TPA: hypothetical protein VH916_02275 [Dehalococcoidia bacterium]|jgi:hypothetical protein